MEKTITCILIDDDDDEHEIFREALGHTLLPIRCLFAFDCLAAVKVITSTQKLIPDFIFMDWNLGGIQGMDCLNELNSVKPDWCQVIIYSGQIQQILFDESNRVNYYCLQKSGSITDLTDSLRLIFETSLGI